MFNIILLIIVLYITISLFEWFLHYYIMHEHGVISKLSQKIISKIHSSHTNHHKETHLTQQNNSNEGELVFCIFDPPIILVCVLIIIILLNIRSLIPQLKDTISVKALVIIILLTLLAYILSWNSIHTRYHNRKVKLTDQIKYSLIPFFNPDTNSSIYKYLFRYHTLHHLNKGESKGNYNIILPLFDFVFNTYTSRVDNRLHFSKNQPKTKQEEWLYKNQVFDIRILVNNKIEYKLENTNEWLSFPYDI